MEEAGRAAADLDKLILDFSRWQEASTDVQRENEQLRVQVKGLEKQCSLHQQVAQERVRDNAQLRCSIETLQGTLARRCDLEDENAQLKEQKSAMQAVATQLEETHRRQMTEAVENLQVVHEAHKKELSRLQEASNTQMKGELDAMQRTIQAKNVEIRQLQTQLADSERDRHTEVVKLRLEYDAKLLKLQKQSSKAQNSQSSSTSVNHEIFRKKLQHAKVEADREISSLRKRVSDLERQLTLASKRRKF